MRDELFDLNIQDAEDIMNEFDRLVESRRESNREQVRRDALNYYLKQGNTIEDAMYMTHFHLGNSHS